MNYFYPRLKSDQTALIKVEIVFGTLNDCFKGDGHRRWNLNSYTSEGKQKTRIGRQGTNGEAPKGELLCG